MSCGWAVLGAGGGEGGGFRHGWQQVITVCSLLDGVRSRCARCTHAMDTLHALIVARIVHTARTHCEHLHYAHAGIAHTSHTHAVNMGTVHTVRMQCAHPTVFSQDLCIYLFLLAIPRNILYGASVLAYCMEAS